jgi:hypothetical protein
VELLPYNALILMGDWCSGEITDTMHRCKKGTKITGKQKASEQPLQEKSQFFLGRGNLFFDKVPFNG